MGTRLVLWFVIFTVIFAAPCFGQAYGSTLIPANPPGGPGGACTSTAIAYLAPTGIIYTCQSNVWTATGSGSGAGNYTLCPAGCSGTIGASPLPVSAATHKQGTNPLVLTYDNASPPNQVDAGITKDTSGNLVITYTGTLSLIVISGPGNVGATGATGPTGPTGPGIGGIFTTLGDTLYAAGGGAATRLPGNTTSTLNIWTQTGTGSVSAAPAWSTLAGAGIAPVPSSACEDVGGSHLNWDPTNGFGCGVTIGSFPGNSFLLSWGPGAIADGTCASNTFALLQASLNSSIAPAYPILPSGIIAMMSVAASGSISIQVCNLSGSSVTLSTLSWGAKIIQ